MAVFSFVYSSLTFPFKYTPLINTLSLTIPYSARIFYKNLLPFYNFVLKDMSK